MPGKHTMLVLVAGWESLFVVTPTQGLVLQKAISLGGSTFVSRGEVAACRKLEALKLGKLTDDGNFTRGGQVDGERWTFKINSKVSVKGGTS